MHSWIPVSVQNQDSLLVKRRKDNHSPGGSINTKVCSVCTTEMKAEMMVFLCPESTCFFVKCTRVSGNLSLPLSILNVFISLIAWNVHEPSPGVYNFSGQQNISNFLTIAQSYNLSVIVRGGPYICGEWEYVSFLLQLHIHHYNTVYNTDQGCTSNGF